ncbi:hypothetical protein H4R34_002716 [Dimargaris verticillata]|uniref:Uncharacterized protein n=1 Tax=Dimargaris verticillata TaxID=2761393 RepID=A0A9W8E9Q9_9FUNG|nr:hypothetical protein H4R34_002716 [Dimargaris verticillata]
MKAALLIVSMLMALAVAQSPADQNQATDSLNSADQNADDGDQGVDTNDSYDDDGSSYDPQGIDDSEDGDELYRRHFVPVDVLDGHTHGYYGLTKRGPVVIERRSFGGGYHQGWPHKYGKVGGYGKFAGHGGFGGSGGVFGIPTIFVNQDKLNFRKKKLQKFNFKNIKNKNIKAAKKIKFVN